MMHFRHLRTMLCAAALAALAVPAHAQLTIDMTKPSFQPVPIAIVDFAGDPMGAQIAEVIRNDLQNCGLFRSIPPGSFIERNVNVSAAPNFADWRGIGAQGLVVGQISQVGGNIKVDFRLWDVVVGQQATGLSFTSQPSNWRRLGHIIADAVYKRVTGEEGYFDTRVAYVSETGPLNNRTKRIAIMDQDGANNRYITDGRTLAITPRFSPTLQEIVYMAYADNNSPPKVYLQNVDSGRRELLGNFPGMSFAPRFSPDGTKVAMSLSKDGNTDLYEMDLRGQNLRRLTNTAAIDTSPCYSPDGTQIVFNSDRGGSQQLYVMGAGGGGEKRISFGDGRYATPVWSPRGDYIAFTKIMGGSFGIGVMRPDGSGERMLASGFLVEGPTWAPNGRVLMYFQQQPNSGGRAGSVTLHQIDITGRFGRQVPTPTDASDPAWSPLIPQ
ncbi:Tol-Pal system beta propeller repeat protein TolB [Enhydrobacter sp.]|uniref:Tol-Pal system beta propeller repeat protein TolB n=1 Tax=Enhydrobacter sp. TaxID=1894999 RepID=UPI002637AF9C|nr:Tol-Pal system beta propeller repeat protein TolB [Enhydrobacter sp.]WIM13466.1 MAG: Tol-Pal system beta propeller repeat protein TolB [Enhydrobacter sp.]